MPTEPTIGRKEYFPTVGSIDFEGPNSDNPLAFKYYDRDRVVAGKSMADHLRFSVAYWHTICGLGEDPFGQATWCRPWLEGDTAMSIAENKLDAAFEFITKLGIPFYCFHDRDLAPEGASVKESEANLRHLVDSAKRKQEQSGVGLLWGTANLFSHPRYMNGAATNPDFRVVTHAAAQVKAAIDATVALGGQNYVFWGGREGYFSLLNTDMKREREHLAIFLRTARDYGRSHGFEGTFLIEPKPIEPTKHQYDFDVAAVIAFLHEFALTTDFKINIENNHATLAGHTYAHEVQAAADAGLLGSLDVNQGDPQSGWDTDEFLHNLYDAVGIMLVLLESGGIAAGGLNFDAKLRRSSTDPEDLFIGHINSMDTLARGLIIADEVLSRSDFGDLRRSRYSSFDDGNGAAFERGELDLGRLADLADELGEPERRSGKQELFESIINRYIR